MSITEEKKLFPRQGTRQVYQSDPAPRDHCGRQRIAPSRPVCARPYPIESANSVGYSSFSPASRSTQWEIGPAHWEILCEIHWEMRREIRLGLAVEQ